MFCKLYAIVLTSKAKKSRKKDLMKNARFSKVSKVSLSTRVKGSCRAEKARDEERIEKRLKAHEQGLHHLYYQ